ncbi:MAG: hypothetical protein SGARI_003012, partial [Bacillariaceae sp.]
MRYFKNEPTKLTLGNHQFTPTKDSFFKSTNKQYKVERAQAHSYVPAVSGGATKNTSSRYIGNETHKHSYVPSIASTKGNEKSTRSWPAPQGAKNVEADAKSAKPTWPPPRSEDVLLPPRTVAKKQTPQMSVEDKAKRDAAARKLQAFVRGTLCRARVSDMLLDLIEGLLSEKEQKEKNAEERQRQLQEQKLQDIDDEYEEVEVCEDAPNSQQDIFDALDFEEEKSSRNEARSILREVPGQQPSKAGNQTKGRSVGFVQAKDQVLEIERAEEYARLPLWWMETCPHGLLPDDEADERFAVTPSSQWNDNEMEEEEVKIAESYVAKEANDNGKEGVLTEEEEIVEEVFVDYEPEEVPEPQPSEDSPEHPTESPVLTKVKAPTRTAAVIPSTQQDHDTDDEPDPSSMSLKDRMNAFNKGQKAP